MTTAHEHSAEAPPDRTSIAMVMAAMTGLAMKGIFARLAYGEGMEVQDVLAG